MADKPTAILGINIEGVIGYDCLPAAVKEQLATAPNATQLNITINSPGGSVWDGLGIYHAIKDHPAPTKAVKVTGIAASMASVIAMVGTDITIGEGATMMIHDPATVTFGNEDAHGKTIEMLRETKTGLLDIYAKRNGKLERNQIDVLMKAETWMAGGKTVELGFADTYSGEASKPVEALANIPNAWLPLLNQYKNTPWAMIPPLPLPVTDEKVTPTVTDKKETLPVNLDDLKKQHPDLLAQHQAEVLANEMKRRDSIMALATPYAHLDFTKQALSDGKTTPEQFAMMAVQHANALVADYQAKAKANPEELVPVAEAPSVEHLINHSKPTMANAKTDDEKKAAFALDEKLVAEFGSYEIYDAHLRNVEGKFN